MNLAISPPTANALPTEWVERLFARLHAVYGKHLADLWADVPMAEVKAAWARALARYEPEAIRAAIDHCEQHVKFAPTLPEFAALCRDLRRTRVVAPELRAPFQPIPSEVQTVLDDLTRHMTEGRHNDPRDWARRIVQRHKDGDRALPRISMEMASEALHLKPQTFDAAREPGSDA